MRLPSNRLALTSNHKFECFSYYIHSIQVIEVVTLRVVRATPVQRWWGGIRPKHQVPSAEFRTPDLYIKRLTPYRLSCLARSLTILSVCNK